MSRPVVAGVLIDMAVLAKEEEEVGVVLGCNMPSAHSLPEEVLDASVVVEQEGATHCPLEGERSLNSSILELELGVEAFLKLVFVASLASCSEAAAAALVRLVDRGSMSSAEDLNSVFPSSREDCLGGSSRCKQKRPLTIIMKM